MSNRYSGKTIIIDSANQLLNLGKTIRATAIHLVMTTTDAVLQLNCGDTTGANVVVQLDKNNLSLQSSDLEFDNLWVTTITAGTGFIYTK